MRRVALKFAYDGAVFDGYARQPTGRTVEGVIIDALVGIRAIEDAGANRFQSASRTDKGVSAAGNVIAIDTDFDQGSIIPALNSKLENVCFYGLAGVDEDFNPRHARRRHYRYFQPTFGVPDRIIFTDALALFEGEHDFTGFSKKDGEAEPHIKVDSVSVGEEDGFLIVDIEAGHFLWQMIRRMVGAALAVVSGELGLADVENSLSCGVHLPRLKPAAPERLVLMDIVYDFQFKNVGVRPDAFENASVDADAKSRLMAQLAASVKTS